MNNLEIAWIFFEIADLLELKGENPFKVRAYRQAAKTIKHLPEELSKIRREGRLEEIPGIGKNLSEKISELLSTGTCQFYEKLKKEVPTSLRELLALPGLGAKSIRLIHENLQVKNIEDLEKAAKEKKIRTLPGMGSKTELNILRALEMWKKREQGLVPVGVALPLAEHILNDLKSLPEVIAGAIGGSLRRGVELVKDVDLIVSCQDSKPVRETFLKHPQARETVASGTRKCTILTWLGIKVHMWLVKPEEFSTALFYFTGSKAHLERVQTKAQELGLSITEYGIYSEKGQKSLEVNNEEEIYQVLDLPYIPPELREDKGEWEAALNGELPQLLELEDIKGDLHLHTTWSDGVNTIEEMVKAAKERGYSYIAITDHSRSLSVAHGLSIERLQEQHKLIKEMQALEEDFKIFTGVECDILQDGTLDYPDEILKECDVVIASIHTGFRQDSEKLTLRAEMALKNPYVNILAHPTGRILGRREAYDIDIDRIFQLAKDEGKVLEINSSVDRLDLNGELVRRAVYEFGIPIAINTDAHDTLRLAEMSYGVTTARRGWLTKEHVINTKSLSELEKFLSGEGNGD